MYTTLLAGVIALAPLVGGVLGGLIQLRTDLLTKSAGTFLGALSGGAMLGVAYALAEQFPRDAGVSVILGSLTASGALFLARRMTISDSGGDSSGSEESPLLVSSLHALVEGVAVGWTACWSTPHAVFIGSVLAIHAVGEGSIDRRRLRTRGANGILRLGVARGVGVAGAVVVTLVLDWAPQLADGALGFCVGGLVFLVLIDSLPKAYQNGGNTRVGLLVSAALGAVIMMRLVVQ
ncbi:MAG: hypothetical protein KC561_07425 [Myxococcales bacterium]|nr:hypothetical protein [Myxococcales bacterium]